MLKHKGVSDGSLHPGCDMRRTAFLVPMIPSAIDHRIISDALRERLR
jgi:hypothetical protein